MAIIGLIFSIAVEEDLKRMKFEQALKDGKGAPLLTNPNSSNLSCEHTEQDDIRTSTADIVKNEFTRLRCESDGNTIANSNDKVSADEQLLVVTDKRA